MTWDEYQKISHLVRAKALEVVISKGWETRPFDDPARIAIIRDMENIYGKGPHDLLGNVINVGDKVAIALVSGRSSNLMVGKVIEISDKGIKAENIVRTYGGVDKPQWYTFPERMVIVK